MNHVSESSMFCFPPNSFSSDCKDDAGEWMRTIAKLMAPVAVMEHVGMIDIKFAGYAHMKESIADVSRHLI